MGGSYVVTWVTSFISEYYLWETTDWSVMASSNRHGEWPVEGKVKYWKNSMSDSLLYKNVDLQCNVTKSLLYFVLLYYSQKSWSIFKISDRFKICWSWQFQNTPYMSILTKFRLRYWMLKTHDTILLFSWVLISGRRQ